MSSPAALADKLRMGVGLLRLARTPGAALTIAVAMVILRVRRRTGRAGRELKLRLSYEGRPFDCVVSAHSDLEVIIEVLVNEQYALPGLASRPQLIFDLGSNIGISAFYFCVRYPEATIHAFEPDPDAFAKLDRNARPLTSVVTHNVAIAAHDGLRRFYISRESWVSSLVRTGDQHSSVYVQARSLPSLMSELGVDHVDLLKLDIEGGEWELLEDPSWLARIGTVIGELHRGTGGQRPEDLLAAFDALDVTVMSGDTQRCTFFANARAHRC